MEITPVRGVNQMNFFDRAFSWIGWFSFAIREDQGGEGADVNFTGGSLPAGYCNVRIHSPGYVHLPTTTFYEVDHGCVPVLCS